MRHRKKNKKFGRKSSHRKAMFRNLSKSLIKYEFMKTTLAKAKELRRIFEPIITLSKKDTLANRRIAFKKLGDRYSVTKLFSILGKRYIDRPGGYMRILKYQYRSGDGALLAFIELV